MTPGVFDLMIVLALKNYPQNDTLKVKIYPLDQRVSIHPIVVCGLDSLDMIWMKERICLGKEYTGKIFLATIFS